MNIIDLFSGCGGLSLGFELAGYNTLLGIDNDEAAINTLKRITKAVSVLLQILQKFRGMRLED